MGTSEFARRTWCAQRLENRKQPRDAAPDACRHAEPLSGTLARRCLYGVVTGKDSEIVTEAGVQTGWPQPLTLMPSCWPGCGVMS